MGSGQHNQKDAEEDACGLGVNIVGNVLKATRRDQCERSE